MLTHQSQLRNENASKWVQPHVDATKLTQGKVLHVVDFVAHASYHALEWQNQDPTWGGEIKVITDPQGEEAPPDGWQNIKGTQYQDTQGNNIISYYVQYGPLGPYCQTDLGPWEIRISKDYGYGLTKDAFNFQQYNLDKGGVENYRVEMQAQDLRWHKQREFRFFSSYLATAAETDTATCTSGLRPNPCETVDLENDILTHELTHGGANRMAAGGTGAVKDKGAPC
ncbi:hypothetical protein FRC01_008680 [Tulasnella sp. 417]|nr:hypothetical protein FRC01_008680 [Tulasnella sp. 417]